jgi:hypothetical protein
MRCLILHWNKDFEGYKLNIENVQFGVFLMELIRFQSILAKKNYLINSDLAR